VAAYTAGGWRFVVPGEGMAVHVKSLGTGATFRSGTWDVGVRASRLVVEGQQVVGARRPAIADPSGGSTVDSQARAALGQILAAMRLHGLIET
jgi:hypothetical protein